MSGFQKALLLLLLLLTQQKQAVAAENFSISTTRDEESWFVYNNVQPGSTITDAVVIKNPLNENIKLAIYALDAKILKDGGFAPIEKETRQRSIGAWLKLDANRTAVPAKTSKKILFSIRIPAHVTPARYMGVVLATAAPPEKSENENPYAPNSSVSIHTRVGVRVYINIAGAPAEQGNNKNYTASIAEKPARDAMQKTPTIVQQKQQLINIATTTTSTSTTITQNNAGTFEKYLVQLGQFVIDHEKNTLWMIALILVLLVFCAWRKKR